MNGEWRKPRILVIEDNPADVALLRLALESADVDCELTVIEDGAEALEFIRQLESSLPNSMPDLTILDLNLPKIDGFEILQAMRADKIFAGAPVAVLSSSSSPRERARIDVFQVRQYITKPADLDEFMKIGLIVKSLLAERNPLERSSSSGI
jgi:CheY-like chemotaxis protein